MSQFLAPALRPEEEEAERSLRPRRLDDFVGQERIKEQLRSRSTPRRRAREALDHVLLAGPPGLGKTTLAQIVREELGVGLRTVAGPALEKKDIAAILTALEPRDVLFVDEIHRLNRSAEEILYPALEDFRLDIVFGQGAAARTLTLDLPPFTLVGATTRTGLLTTPLRDRFGMTFRLGYYDPGQLGTIVRRSAAHPRRRDRRRRRRGDRRALARDAAHREPHPPSGTRRRRGQACRRDHDGRGAGGARAARGRRPGARAHRPRAARGRGPEVRGRAGRALDARGLARRGARHDRGRLRAVPAPARLPPADAARPRDHRARSRATSARRETTGASSERRDLDACDGRPAGRARAADPAPGRPLQGRARARGGGGERRARRRLALPAEDDLGRAGVRVRQHVPALRRGRPEEVIVPLGAIRELRIAAPSHEQPLGFAGSAADT